jgi:hypothetical protein
MSHRKTVTEKTLAANRLNAKRSTGPRTERGKNTSKFNAVTTGLFAKHVVIPSCDRDGYQNGNDPEEQFSKLLEALQQEYKPEGPSEVFWVAHMAECMWKQRRVSRSERSFVVAQVGWEWKSSDAPMAAERRNLYPRDGTGRDRNYANPLAGNLRGGALPFTPGTDSDSTTGVQSGGRE